MSLALTRVDDRLIHGQVILAWGAALSISRIVVADDEVAANSWERDLMAAVAEDLHVEVIPIHELASRVESERDRSGATLVLFRSPAAALAAIEAGTVLSEINLGGLHYAPGRERVLDYLYLNDDDRAALRALQRHGVRLIAQDVPTSRAINAREFLHNGGAR